MNIFKNEKIIETGIKHGTVTLIKNGIEYEITTYRIDGEYNDNRRPDFVEFTNDINKDLQRRDFTINAIIINCEDFKEENIMTILEKRKLAPERDEHLKKGEFTVLNGEYSKNFNVYVVGEKHKEAVDFIKVALDRSTDNVLGFGIKMGCQKNFNVIVWDEEDIPEEYRV